MCDGKCRGKPVPPFLKFVAACNPYRWFVRLYYYTGIGYNFVIKFAEVGDYLYEILPYKSPKILHHKIVIIIIVVLL